MDQPSKHEPKKADSARPDAVLTDIADYVCDYSVTSAEIPCRRRPRSTGSADDQL